VRARQALPVLLALAACSRQEGASLVPPDAGGGARDAGAPAPDAGASRADAVFDPGRVIEVRLELEPAAWQAILRDPLAEAYQPAALVFDGRRLEQVMVRTKGNSSLNAAARAGSHRFPFKVDVDRVVPDQTLEGHRKLSFSSGMSDPSMMREHLACALYAQAGLRSPRTAFVDLTVGGEHLGLYTMVEQVDGRFLDEGFEHDDGDLYKPESPAGTLADLGTDPAAYAGLELERNEETSTHAAFLALVAALDRGDRAALEASLDVEAALRYLAVTALLSNLDSYLGSAHNYYLYETGGRFRLIPWDLNEAFGNFRCGCDRRGMIELEVDEPTCGPLAGRPLAARLLAEPDLRARYHAILRALVEGPLAEATFAAEVDRVAALIRPHVEADPTRLFTVADFERALREDSPAMGGAGGGTGGQPAIGLVAFARERGAAVLAQLEGRAPSSAGGRGGCQGGGMMGGGMMGGGMTGPRPPCGDGTCDATERQNPRLCPRDCEARPEGFEWCGDGLCDALERWEGSCAADCG
jgi:spore coat protein H